MIILVILVWILLHRLGEIEKRLDKLEALTGHQE